MKILTVCSQGNKRSVFTRFILNHHHDVVAIGAEVNSPETIRMLSEWADVILIAEPIFKKAIPVKFQKKVDNKFTIGPDIYPTNITGMLKDLVYLKLKALKYV